MVGIVLAFCSTPLVARDWTSVFYIYGCLGIVWTAFFWRFTASHPQKHSGIGTPELQLLLAEHGSRAVLQLDTEEEEGTELTAVSSHSGTAVAPGGDGVAAGGAKPLTACALATNLPFIAIVVGHCTTTATTSCCFGCLFILCTSGRASTSWLRLLCCPTS